MKHLGLSTFLIYLIAIPPVMAVSSEPQLQKVDLRLCNKNQQSCLAISAQEGDVSQIQNTMSLSKPKVIGLGFEKRQISSAIIDFLSGNILLRERQNDTYVGEWSVNLDTLAVNFYTVPK